VFFFFKQTTLPTYTQARWEMAGGWLPFDGIRHIASGFIYGSKYHVLTLIDVLRSIGFLKLPLLDRLKLWLRSVSCIVGHFGSVFIRYKTKRVSNMETNENG
jgi:hypothetical protein